jgi:hypothetical protein
MTFILLTKCVLAQKSAVFQVKITWQRLGCLTFIAAAKVALMSNAQG